MTGFDTPPTTEELAAAKSPPQGFDTPPTDDELAAAKPHPVQPGRDVPQLPPDVLAAGRVAATSPVMPTTEDMGVEPLAKLDQHVENVAKAAGDADVDKLAGFGGWAQPQIRAYLRSAYSVAPTLAEMASLEPDRFAAVAHNAAALEQVVRGPPTKEELDYYRANNLPVPDEVTHHGLLTVALQKAFVGAGASIYQIFSDVHDVLKTGANFGELIARQMQGDVTAKMEPAAPDKNLDYLKQYLISLELLPVEGRGTMLAKGVDLAAGFLPTALAFGLVPAAAFPVLAAQGYGNLRLQGVDPAWAMSAGLVQGWVSSQLGSKFISGLAGRAGAQDAVGAFAAQLQREFAPSLTQTFLSHARSGYLMLASMNAADGFAVLADKYFSKGQSVDASDWVQLAHHTFVDSLASLPFAAAGGLGEFYQQKGRQVAAYGDNAVLHTMRDLIQSASDPGAASQVLQAVVDQRRTLRMLDIAAGEAEERGGTGKFRRVAEEKRSELRLMVSAPEFRRAAMRMGVAPEDLQRRLVVNGKIGFSDAEVMGIPLEAPIRTLAHELKDSVDGMSLHADVPSLDAAKAEPKVDLTKNEQLEAWYQKREEALAKEQAAQPERRRTPREPLKPADASEKTSEEKPVAPTPAPKPVQRALEADAVRTVESMPRDQLYSDVFQKQIKKAREDFKKPELSAQAADSWERARGAEEARKVAVKEYDKLATGIQKLAGEGARDRAYAGGALYGQLYDSILANDPGRAREALDSLPADATSVDHDDLLKAISHHNIDDAPLTAARVVQKALMELQESVRVAEDVTYFDGKEHSRAEVIASFDAGLVGRKPPGFSGGLFGWAAEQRAAWEAYKMTHHALLQPFGAWGQHRSYWFIQSRGAEDRMVGRHLDLTEMPKGLEKLGNQPVAPLPGWTGHPDAAPKYRKDAWRILLNVGNEQDALRFVERSGVEMAQVHDWLDNTVKLTKGEYDHVQGWWNSLKEILDLHGAAQSNMLKAPLLRKTPRTISTPHGTYTGGDAPFGWFEDSRGGPQAEKETRTVGASPGRWAAPGEQLLQKQVLSDRTPDTRWDTLKGDVGKLIHDASFGEFNRDTRNMLADERFKDVVTHRLGQDWYDRLVDWFDVVQRGSLTDDAQGVDLAEKVFGVGKRIATNAAFNTNIPVLAAQPTHFLVAGARFGITNPEVWRQGIGRSLTAAGKADARANSEVVPFRTDRYRSKMTQLWADVTGDQTKYGQLLDKTNIPGMALQHAMDSFLSNALWHTFKIQAIHEGLSLEDAHRQADLRTDQSMPAVSILDQSALNRSKIWGAFTLVRNFPQAVYNLKAMDSWETREDVESGRSNIFTGYGGLAARRLGMVAGLTAGYYLIGHGRSVYEQALDQEHLGQGTARWLARTAIPESFFGNPIAHTMLKAVAEAFTGEHANLRNIHLFESPVEGLTSGLLRDIHQAATADDWQEALFPAFSAFGRATGLLSPSLVRSLKGGYKVLQPGDFTWAQGASWLMYGPDRKESNIFGGGQ